MQISLLGRLQNKSLDHYDCLFVASISQQSQETPYGQYP